MIITRLIGGLGNQMFQYALGRFLAEKHNTRLKLDVTGFQKYKLHKYSLAAYNINADLATVEEINSMNFCIKEKHFSFDPDVLDLPDNVYLDGYWQSEKYFFDVKNILKKEFTVKFEQTGKNKEIAEVITSTNSVSIHVRRCDYITNKTFVVCCLDYYYRCISFIDQNINSPEFFVFSDDPNWVKDNLKINFKTTFISCNNADTNYEDLRLMSLCKHNIIANSTFSWWSTWLNNNLSKIVIAPKQWFESCENNIKDLLPNEWIIL